MPSDRKPSLILPVAVVAALLAGYVAAYYALVVPRFAFSVVGAGVTGTLILNAPLVEYRVPVLRGFFAPLHWLDRRIRPHIWEPMP